MIHKIHRPYHGLLSLSYYLYSANGGNIPTHGERIHNPLLSWGNQANQGQPAPVLGGFYV